MPRLSNQVLAHDLAKIMGRSSDRQLEDDLARLPYVHLQRSNDVRLLNHQATACYFLSAASLVGTVALSITTGFNMASGATSAATIGLSVLGYMRGKKAQEIGREILSHLDNNR